MMMITDDQLPLMIFDQYHQHYFVIMEGEGREFELAVVGVKGKPGKYEMENFERYSSHLI